MGDKTGIEWTDATWNPFVGCSVVSPGCTNCYAMKLADRFEGMVEAHKAKCGGDPGPMAHYEGTTTRGKYSNKPPVWTGKINKAPDTVFMQPLRWTRPRMVFVNSMSDLFHESVPDEWIDEVFAIMALCPQHIFQILTKRPERMMQYLLRERGNGKQDTRNHLAWVTVPQIMDQWFPDWGNEPIDGAHRARAIQACSSWPLPNVWLGVSVEDQRRAQERIPLLLKTPAAVRFLSMEPLVGPVDLNNLLRPAKKDPDKVPTVQETCLYTVKDRPAILPMNDEVKVDWVIVGGESGPDARPMHPAWVRLIRDECEMAKVPLFFKQWGAWVPLLPDHEGRKDWMIVDISGGVDVPDDRWPDETLGEEAMVKLGKKQSGNTLDGKQHMEFPLEKIFN